MQEAHPHSERASKDVWLLKLDENGIVTWQKTYGGVTFESATSVQQTSPDGGYIVVGTTVTFGAGEKDVWLLKLDANGDVTWQKTYGGTAGDEGYSVQQTSDGGYIVAGGTRSFGEGNYDIWLLKLDGGGDIVWQKTYGGKHGITHTPSNRPLTGDTSWRQRPALSQAHGMHGY